MPITQQIIKLSEQYVSADSSTIKANLIQCIKQSKYNRCSKELADIIGVDIQTIYSYRKAKNGNIPNFITALKLCDAIDITIEELIKE